MLIIAHRGASAYAPENTVKAFNLAFQQGAHGIECDVIQVRGKSLIIHDDRLERTTNGSGYVIDTSEEELATLNAGEGQAIPDLAGVFNSLPADGWCNLELKRISNIALWADELTHCLKTYPHAKDKLVISSFNHLWLSALAPLFPELKFAYLIAHYPLDTKAFANQIQSFAINVDLNIVDEAMVKTIQDQGKKVWVFTVDHKEDIKRCLAMGVDGVFTNTPDVALTICQN